MAPALSTLSSSKDSTNKPANLESTKSIVAKKKKNPQKKIREFFSPAGPNKLPSRNFQGFPIKQCIFEPTVNKWVYQPTGWGNYLPFPFTKASWLFCEHCLLKPCFAMRKHCDIFCVEEEKEDMIDNNVIFIRGLIPGPHRTGITAGTLHPNCWNILPLIVYYKYPYTPNIQRG